MLVFYRPGMIGSGDDKRMRDLTEAEQRRKAEESRLAEGRIAIERDAERLAQQRQQLEERALAEAQRREQAAADLRAAVAARLKREAQARAFAEARVASEQAALAAANDKIQMERSLEANALSRAAAERDAAQLAEQRLQREMEAARAEAARREAEAQLRAAAAAARQANDKLDSLGPPTVPAGSTVNQEVEFAAETPEAPPRPSWRISAAIAVAVCLGLGWFAATQSGLGGRVVALRLDTDAQGFARRAATADFQDSNRRRVNPTAIQ